MHPFGGGGGILLFHVPQRRRGGKLVWPAGGGRGGPPEPPPRPQAQSPQSLFPAKLRVRTCPFEAPPPCAPGGSAHRCAARAPRPRPIGIASHCTALNCASLAERPDHAGRFKTRGFESRGPLSPVSLAVDALGAGACACGRFESRGHRTAPRTPFPPPFPSPPTKSLATTDFSR